MVTLPSSFAGGMQGALESIQRGQLPQSVLSPVKTPSQVKQTTKKKTYEVEFENGTTVEFDRQPTMQDIDEAWSQVQNYKAPAPESPIGTSFLPQSTTQAINRLKEAPKVYKDVVGGAISSIPSQLGNIAKFGTDVGNALLPGQPLAGIGQRAQQLGQQGQEKVQEFYGARPETPYTKVGEFAGEMVGGTLLGGGLVKGASMLPKAQQVATKLPFITKVAKGATEGLGFDVASQGEAGIGTVVGGALPIAGVGLSKGVEYFTKKLPTSLQLQGLMNPAKVTLLKKQLQTEGTTAPDDVAKWMIDRNIKGTKEDIIQTLINRAEQSKQAVDDSLASIQKTFSSLTAKQALQQSYDDLAKVVGLEDEAQTALTLLGKDQYTLSELNQIKRILDRQYNLYTKTGDPTAGLKAQGLQNIRRNLRETIENEAEKLGIKNIRALNNETQIARTMADAIGRKESADAVREALTAFAPTGVGGILGGVAGPFDNNTVEGKVGNILLGMFVGRVAGSTKLKTNIASLLSKLSKKEVSALDAYLKAGGKSALPIQILEKIDDTIKLLPPASGKPLTSSGVIDVKPMTGFLPGIMQKQSEAISSKVGTQPGTKSILQSLSKSSVNSEKGILPKPQQKKVNIPGKKVNNPIIQKLAKKQETPKTPQVETKKKSALPLSQKSEVKYSKPIEEITPRALVRKARDISGGGAYRSMSVDYLKKEINDSFIGKNISNNEKKKLIELIEKTKTYKDEHKGVVKDYIKMKDFIETVKKETGYDNYKVPSILDSGEKEIKLYRSGDVDRVGHGGVFLSDSEQVATKIYGGDRATKEYTITIPDKKDIKSYRSVMDAYLDVGPDDIKKNIIKDIKSGELYRREKHYRQQSPSIMKDFGTTDWEYDFNRKLDKIVGAEMKKRGIKIVEYTNPEDLPFSQYGLDSGEYVVYDKSLIK